MDRQQPRYAWRVLPADRNLAAGIARECGVSSIVSLLLSQRAGGVSAAKKFLTPSMMDLHSPRAMKDLHLAAQRLAHAVKNHEKIVIFGDYDADGITATAIMVTILRTLGSDPQHYLPNRMREGYGISSAFVEKAIAEKISLVVTVDCGTSEGDNIDKLKNANIDVIITDHHEPGNLAMPKALATLNPKRHDATYPFRELVGAGVAFKLAWGLCEEISGSEKVGEKLQNALLACLPLAMIGTVADVAEMVAENRIISHYGLKFLAQSSVGLRAILKIADVNIDTATCHAIGWAVAPRINAAGRVGEADLALSALLETDLSRAAELAKKLNEKNYERKQLCEITIKNIESLITEEDHKKGALVVAAQNLHEGVIGIAAGRLAERYRMPCAVISINQENHGKGSARGVEGINLYAIIERARKYLLTFGGHEQAAGFSIMAENIPAFRKHFISECQKQTALNGGTPPINIDCEISFTEINDTLLREISRLAPFGDGNLEPVFLARNIRITGTPQLRGHEPRQIFTFTAMQSNIGYQAIMRNTAVVPELLELIDCQKKRVWDLVFTLKYSHFYNVPRLELCVRDMQPSK